MPNKILNTFSKNLKVNIHYVILVGLIILYYHLLEIHIVHSSISIIIGLLLVVLVGDQIIHRVMGLK